MSALRRGMRRVKILPWIARTIPTVTAELIGDVKALVSQYRSHRHQRHLLVELHRINDHALRDIGLVRDRFSGIILDDSNGDVVETMPPSADESRDTAVVGRHHMSGYNGRERRCSDRRHAQRRDGDRAFQEPSRPDRRAFDRRTRACQVLDCRDLFSGRSRFLLT